MKHDTELVCFFWANDSHWNISTKMNDSLRYMFHWSPVQSKATLLANNSQHFWMLHVASVCTPNCMLSRVVAQSLKPVKVLSQQLLTFLLLRDRRSMAQQCWIRLPQLFQHCWSHAHVLHIVCKVLWVVSFGFPWCTAIPNIAGSCCSHLHTILVPRARRFLVTWSGSLQIKSSGSGDENVCTQLPTWTQQLPPLLV